VSYLVLARKYRPSTFADVTGCITDLKKAITADRVATLSFAGRADRKTPRPDFGEVAQLPKRAYDDAVRRMPVVPGNRQGHRF
jgi:hypothetical protein